MSNYKHMAVPFSKLLYFLPPIPSCVENWEHTANLLWQTPTPIPIPTHERRSILPAEPLSHRYHRWNWLTGKLGVEVGADELSVIESRHTTYTIISWGRCQKTTFPKDHPYKNITKNKVSINKKNLAWLKNGKKCFHSQNNKRIK